MIRGGPAPEERRPQSRVARAPTATLPVEYFHRLYAADPDPWRLATRWYEQRKYALTLAALPAERFDRGLEVGCSVGVLTAGLAARCRTLVAMDPSPVALAAARTRVPAEVDLVLGAAPADWPPGAYDLIVLSEVGYYFSAADLEHLLDLVQSSLAGDGVVLACHWRHPVSEYPLSGDEVHAVLQRWPRLSRVEDLDFRLDVLVPDGGPSVAAREGLA